MSPAPTEDPAAVRDQSPRALLIEELEQRIENLENLDEASIGRFTGWDWLLCILGGVAVPAFAMWWFAG